MPGDICVELSVELRRRGLGSGPHQGAAREASGVEDLTRSGHGE